VGPGRDSGYDAAALIGLAMVSARSYTDGRKIAAAVYNLIDPKGTPIHATPEDYAKAIALLSAGKTIRYIGATGPMTFDKYGDVTTPFVGWRVEGGKYVPKKTLSTEAVAAVKRKTGG
jgi:branched-chain amino acid transport system substrate-binding protein